MDLSHVLWIGGGPGSGKSSIAQALSQRFDLQLYAIDDHDRAHEPRLPVVAAGSPAQATPDELLERFVTTSRHRFRLVLEDLAALPPSPLAIVEGAPLFPTLVAAVLRAADHALFLIPGGDEQLTRLVAREAADVRLATLTVDAPLEEMIERAAAHFLPVISAAADRSP